MKEHAELLQLYSKMFETITNINNEQQFIEIFKAEQKFKDDELLGYYTQKQATRKRLGVIGTHIRTALNARS